MFDFLRRDQPGIAAVYFPGSAPPAPDAFLRLRDAGYRLADRAPGEFLWSVGLEHPAYGSAELACHRDSPPIDEFIRFANSLSPSEKAAALGSSSSVVLRVPARRKEVLRDRKTMLRISRDLLGVDGVMVLDTASQLPWSRAALADELAHDADLDVEALYCLHSVFEGEPGDPEGRDITWLHSHGLAELGGFDIDFVRPHPEFVDQCSDIYRALAMQVLERQISADGPVVFGQPNGEARLVPIDEFRRTADPAFGGVIDNDNHLERRSVMCERGGRRLFGFGGSRPEPLKFARRAPQPFVAYVSNEMTTLMAERARATIDVLRRLTEEFAEFEVVAIVKLGYPTPDGSKEHLWFTAHAIGETTVDATLENDPFAVDLKPGERAERPLELLTDWMLMTPAGTINPRSQAAARSLREGANEIRAAMKGAAPR